MSIRVQSLTKRYGPQTAVNGISFEAHPGEIVGFLGPNGAGKSTTLKYSMLWRVIESQVVPLSEKEGIGQIVWSPIAQGVLTGKYLPGKKAPAGSRATDKKGGANMISGFMKEPILEAVQKLIPIAAKVDLTLAQLAIAWVLQNPNVSSAIIGATKPAQIKENVKASGVKLDQSIMGEIDAALKDVITSDPAKTLSPKPRA